MKFRPSEIEHPIKMYIRRDLGITVEQFGKIAGIPQSTLATWIKRERRVEKLPIDFYSSLATVSEKKIEEVFQELVKWQGSTTNANLASTDFQQQSSNKRSWPSFL